MNQVSVIILSWNSKSYLQKFLPHLIAHTPGDLADLVVVDNGSTDGTPEWIKSTHPEIQLKVLERNHGYAGGYRIAIEGVESTYTVLLNSDVEVTPGWLERLTAFMEMHPEAGAAAPKIRSYQYRDHFEYAGAAGGWIDRFGYPFCRGRLFNSIEPDQGQFNLAMRSFWASGACLMVRTSAYRQAGGLDPLFFAHMEEIDLCWRLHSHGFEVWYVPDSVIYHVGGGALPNESPQKLYLNFRNNLLLLRKNLPANMLVRVLFIRKVLDGVAAVQYLFKGKGRFFLAVLKAHRDFRSLWKKEYKDYTAHVHPSPHQLEGWYNQSIVAAFFIAGKRKFNDLRLHR